MFSCLQDAAIVVFLQKIYSASFVFLSTKVEYPVSWFISDLKRIICDCILICRRNQKPFSTLCCWIFITNIQEKSTLFSFIVSFLCLSFHWTSLFNGHFNDSRYLVTVSFPYTEIQFDLYIFIYKSRMDHSFDIH